MFPRGARFEPEKESEVPGPNAYTIPTDSQLDAYKRGAFLEKADRFNAEKAAEAGPSSALSNPARPAPKSSKSTSANLVDRYAILQKKVDDLERVHKEDKRSHQAEVERLKSDLVAANKANVDLSTRLDKQRKHEESLTTRLNELVKTTASDKAEIKELRVKLRSVEHERTQLTSKQTELGEIKKTTQSLEAKRKEEVRERDKKIADLEKIVSSERKRKEIAEVCCMDLRTGKDKELEGLRGELEVAKTEASNARIDAQDALASLSACTSQRDAALAQSQQSHTNLKRLASLYSQLCSTTVSRTSYDKTEYARLVIMWRSIRLERKLANSEAQVVELAHLLRQMKEKLHLAGMELRDAQGEIHSLRAAMTDRSVVAPVVDDVQFVAADVQNNLKESHAEVQAISSFLDRTSCERYRILVGDLLVACSSADRELLVAQQEKTHLADVLANTKSKLLEDVACAQAGATKAEELLRLANALADDLRESVELQKADVATLTERLYEEERAHEAKMEEERILTGQLRSTVQKQAMAEEGLRAQIDVLTSELAGVEELQNAYQQLSDEVGELLTRNALAEDVAQQLSKFNAEIVGHRNPAQRIMYLERIRNELADSRQKLAMLAREHEVLQAKRDELEREVDMYKSVAVSERPRGAVTRVKRVPLASLNQQAPSPPVEKATCILDMIPAEGEMTLDELM